MSMRASQASSNRRRGKVRKLGEEYRRRNQMKEWRGGRGSVRKAKGGRGVFRSRGKEGCGFWRGNEVGSQSVSLTIPERAILSEVRKCEGRICVKGRKMYQREVESKYT